MPIKRSAGSSIDRLPAMFSTKGQTTGFDVAVGFCYWSWPFTFLHQNSSQIDGTQACTAHFSSDFIPKICFCHTLKLHLASRFGLSKAPATRQRAEEGQGLEEGTTAAGCGQGFHEEGPWFAAWSSVGGMACPTVSSTHSGSLRFHAGAKVRPSAFFNL